MRRNMIVCLVIVYVSVLFGVNAQPADGTGARVLSLTLTTPAPPPLPCQPGTLGCGGSGILGGQPTTKLMPVATTFTCRVVNLTRHNVVHFAKEASASSNITGMRQWYDVSYDSSTTYPALFTVTEIDIDNVGTSDYTLTILPPVTYLSGGLYSCAVNVSNSTGTSYQISRQETQLFIPYGPSFLQLSLDGVPIANNSNVNVTLGSTHKLECAACGYPSLSMTLTHGNQDLGRLVEYSDEFLQYSPAPNPMYPFQEPVCRNMRAVVKRWAVDVSYLDVPVFCGVTVFKTIMTSNVSFSPVIQDGPPQFVCKDIVHVPMMNASKVFDVTCWVYARPPLTAASFLGSYPSVSEFQALPANTWYPKTQGNDVIVFAGQVIAGDPMNVTKAAMILRTTSLDRDALNGRIFVFKAANAKGATMHQIKLTKGAASKGVTAISSATIVFLLIVNVFFTHGSS